MQKRFFYLVWKKCIATDHVSENEILLDPHLRRIFRLDKELVTCHVSKLSLGNFTLARDQVVYLETAEILKTSRVKQVIYLPFMAKTHGLPCSQSFDRYVLFQA